MSNSLIPMGPSSQETAEMARILRLMNGGDGVGNSNLPAVQQPVQGHYAGGSAGTRLNESRNNAPPPPPPPIYAPGMGASREEVDAMKSLLETINNLSGDETPAPRKVMTESYSAPAQQTSRSSSYQVMVTIKESKGKEVNRYNVVDENRQDVVSDLVIKESATSIMKMMNKGLGLDSAKVQEVLELEEDYNRNRIEAGKHRSRYQQAMDLGESAAANVFKDRFNAAKANALVAQDTIKSISESIR